MVNLGPGTLKIGPTGSEIAIECLVNNVRIAADKTQDDPRTKLCGTVTPGKITYDYAISGNLDTDTDDPDGIFAYSQAHAGQQVAFEFVPNTVGVTKAVGTLIIDPLDFGADEFGAAMDSDFEWSILGQPTYTFPAPTP